MAQREFLATTLLSLLLCLSCPCNARAIRGIKEYQNISIAYANKSSALANSNFSSYSNLGVTKDVSMHWAIITTRDEEGSYYGAKATLNVWGLPSVSDRQESFSQITLRNDEDVISAGWHVFPEFYGDHDTHFYTLWVSGATPNKACYNLECEGFKRDNTSLYIPGHKIEPLSTYNGGQFEIILKIKQNNDTGDWSLYYGPNGDKPVGSWPKSLFTKLADKATTVDVGGAVLFNTGEPSPPMGSGQFSSEKAKKAAYAKDIQFVDKSGRSYKPGDDVIGEYADISHCYSISTFGNLANGFYFGGPGGCI